MQLLRLIQTYAYSDLYLSHSDLILTQELLLWQTYPYLDLILIANSSYSDLILIQISRMTHTYVCIRRIII